MEAPASSRASRWSDGPPTQSSNASAVQEVENSEKRPAATVPEPPLKKSKLDSFASQAGNISAGYGGDMPSGPSGNYSEVPSGVNTRSSTSNHGQSSSFANQGFSAAPAYTGERAHVSFPPGSARGPGTAAIFFKTKLCSKFKQGACTFNERCHFAHGMEELRKPPSGWEDMVKQGGPGSRSLEPPRKSNKPCRFYLEGNCPYGEKCTFSHGNDDFQGDTVSSMDRSSGPNAAGRSNYKTRLCSRWEKEESCVYGERCHFAHGQAELRAYSGGPAYSNMGPTGPNMYADATMMNPPSLPAPYGPSPSYGNTGFPSPAVNYGSAAIPPASNYANVGVPPPATSAHVSTYPMPGGVVNPYGSQQDTTNGYQMNYPYWNQENKWDMSNPSAMAPPPAPAPVSAPIPAPAPAPIPAPASMSTPAGGPATVAPQMYGQINQQPSWAPNYPADGGFPKSASTLAPYYNPDFTQPQQQQQQQSFPYYGPASTYQEPNPGVNPPVIPDATHTTDGNAYYTVNHGSQQQGYTGTYNTV